jgi:hypothetical protein
VATTQIYTHVLNRGGMAVPSPLGAALRMQLRQGGAMNDRERTEWLTRAEPGAS